MDTDGKKTPLWFLYGSLFSLMMLLLSGWIYLYYINMQSLLNAPEQVASPFFAGLALPEIILIGSMLVIVGCISLVVSIGQWLLKEQKKLEHLKDDLADSLVHDLRSPLSIIRGYSQLARKNQSDQRTIDRSLSIIEKTSEQLVGMVSDILEVRKINTGSKTKNEVFDLQQVAKTVTDQYTNRAHMQGVRLLSQNNAPTLVRGVKKSTARVLRNLYDNALKFTPEGGSVTLRISSWPVDPSMVVIRVQDTGSGIPLDKQSHIFERYFQAHTKQKRPSTGLGLAGSKQLIEQMGGTMWFTSEQNVGTAFYFTLPKA